MLGFGKKKDKNKAEDNKKSSQKESPEQSAEKTTGETPGGEDIPEQNPSPPKKKKRFSKRLILMLVLVLAAVGGACFVVYFFYFAPQGRDSKANYTKIQLEHVNLPEEMLRFSFDYFPDLYGSLIVYNRQMKLIDGEIARIDILAQKYPEQIKIAQKEKKVWEKAKAALEKAFLKIEKPVKDAYVLFRVNRELGLARIEEKSSELTELAATALAPALELTDRLKSTDEAPQGFIKGNIYKLKKKFL